MTQIEVTPTISLTGKWKPYPAYKDSGVDWLGKIPEHWKASRLKYIARLCYGDSLPSDARQEGDIQVFGSNGPVGFHTKPNTFAPVLVIGRKGSFGKINFSNHPCFAIDTTYYIDVRNSRADLRWLFYAMQLLRLDAISEDSAIPGLSRELTEEQWLPTMSIQEQRAIATFLDRETARINTLIAKKERLIKLLQEKRAALISHAVTKGLDPTVPMKDSGVEWLGEIPAHWEVMRLKFAAKLESGHTPNRTIAEYWENCTIPWVTLNDVSYLKDHDYICETTNYINNLGLVNSSARLLPTDTVVLSRDATVGRCGILGRPMATSQHFVDWICHEKLLSKYLLHVFRGPMQQEFERLTMGATIRTIGMVDVKGFCVPIPPISEQKQVVMYLDNETAKIDALVSRIHEGVEKLKEYSTALISAAVTGKTDVREAIENYSEHL